MGKQAPLAVLPLSNVVRSLLTTTISASPLLLPPSLRIMSWLVHTSKPALNPDKNPLLRYLVKRTFYAQFCAGETPDEVRGSIESLKRIGFTGVILGYAGEVVMSSDNNAALEGVASAEDLVRKEVEPWAARTMETVRLATEGDFVGLKFTGAGQDALQALTLKQLPSPILARAIDDICTLAKESKVRLLFDAEQQAVQEGIDIWTLRCMRKYNSGDGDKRAVIYGTYQTYLKAAPRILSSHLDMAAREGFTLGVKLVRGAYLGTDPRHLIHDTKPDTDAAYNDMASAVMRRQWASPLVALREGVEFPDVDLVLASHNAETVQRARDIMKAGKAKCEVVFAQLQGMADELSCALVSDQAATTSEKARWDAAMASCSTTTTAPPLTYKYLVWGTTGECMKYLLRRAEENRDALQRTKSGREAMQAELVRRFKGVFGWS